MKSAFNTFKKGMSRDLDKSQQIKDTYRNSVNGRVIFKEDGSYAWCNVLGNEVAFQTTTGYRVQGTASINNKLIILSWNGTNSEIGVVKLVNKKTAGVYEVFFNDYNDPNGDTLDLNAKCEVRSYAEVSDENDTVGGVNDNEFIIERIYWTDDYNEPRSFNLACSP